MIIDNKRALAYIQIVHDITPIEGADNIELVHVNAWTLIAKKGEFKDGDKCVFFEIDSKLPSDNPAFEFLAAKHYKVKTYKLGKFGVVSQGLALPLSALPELDPNIEINTDVTDILKVEYAVKEDNYRKAEDPAITRFKSYKAKHPKFYSNRFIKWLMRFKWFYRLQVRIHGGKVSKKYGFPTQYVSKTDEERIENCEELLKIKTPVVVTEKIDGTSTTVLVERLHFGRFKTYICSRNVCFGDGKTLIKGRKVYNNQDNIYVEMAQKYNIPEHLIAYLKEHKNMKWACVQGESYGEGWQGNPLKLKGHHFAAFNFKDPVNGRLGSEEGKELLATWGIPWVPIVYTDYILLDTADEMIEAATGPSAINPDVLREGWVIRSKDGKMSFKAVSRKYLLSKKE